MARLLQLRRRRFNEDAVLFGVTLALAIPAVVLLTTT